MLSQPKDPLVTLKAIPPDCKLSHLSLIAFYNNIVEIVISVLGGLGLSRIVENIDLIDGTMCNCYSVTFNGTNFLIDAGTKGAAKKIISFYSDRKEKPAMVLITHYHPDHIGGLQAIHDKFNPEIFVPDNEMEVVAGREKPAPTSSMMSRFVSNLMKIPAVTEIKPASECSVEGLDVLKTQGHTPGSTSYYFPSLNAVFVGDALGTKNGEAFVNKAFTLDIDAAMKAKDRLLAMKGVTMYPGHGEPLLIK